MTVAELNPVDRRAPLLFTEEVGGMRRILGILMAAALVVVATGSYPAAAKGSGLTPVRDRYEPGDVATLVGYTGGPQLLLNRPPGPYRAFLEDQRGRFRIEVGQLELADTGRRGWDALRVVARFLIPLDLTPGQYGLTYCTDRCELPLLGDFTGGFLSVGVDPAVPWSHSWPLDEPEIANLPDHAILTGPGYQTTAGDVRAGRIPTIPSGPPGSPTASGTPESSGPTVTSVASELLVETTDSVAAPWPPHSAVGDDDSGGALGTLWLGLGAIALAAGTTSPLLRARRRQARRV